MTQKASAIALTSPIKPLQRYTEDDIDSLGTDIRISIVEKSENDSAELYKAISTYKDKEVGLLVSVPKVKEGNKGFAEGIILESIGCQVITSYMLYEKFITSILTCQLGS